MFSGAKTAVIDEYLQAALARFHKVNDRQGINRIHNKLGYLLVAQGEGDYDRAQAYYQSGLQVCQEIQQQRRIEYFTQPGGALYLYRQLCPSGTHITGRFGK